LGVTELGWLELVLAYLALHLAAYVVKLRDLPAFGQEATIFGYHLWSAVLVSGLSLVAWLSAPSMERFAVAVAAISLHGIYSTSFLELWSLAEGGYSLSILRLLRDARLTGRVVEATTLQAIGARKKGSRLQGVLKLRLAREHGEQFELTPLGQAVAHVFAAVAWAADLRELG
jgi:hypothetical protein